jgi:hypothetical protein
MIQDGMVWNNPPDGTPVTTTPLLSSFSAKPGSTRAVMKADFPLGSLSFSFPWMVSCATVTSVTLPWATSRSNSL